MAKFRDITRGLGRGMMVMASIIMLTNCGMISFFQDESEDKDNRRGTENQFPEGFNLVIEHYASCAEIQEDVRTQLLMRQENDRLRNEYYKHQERAYAEDSYNDGSSVPTSDAAMGSAAGGGAPPAPMDESESFTNTQEKGVDEADFIKVGAHHIFVAGASDIEVVDRPSLSKIGNLETDKLQNLTLYTDGNRLIMLGTKDEQEELCFDMQVSQSDRINDNITYDYMADSGDVKPVPAPGTTNQCHTVSRTQTVIRVLAGNPGELPTLVGEQTIQGAFDDSRYIGGRLVLVFKSTLPILQYTQRNIEQCGSNADCIRYLSGAFGNSNGYYGGYYGYNSYGTEDTVPEAPIALGGDEMIEDVRCSAIGRPYVKDLDFRLTKIASVNAREITEEPKLTAIFGGGGQIYMTTSNLYVSKHGLVWTPWVEPVNDPAVEDTDQNSPVASFAAPYNSGNTYDIMAITKVAYNAETGDLGATAVGTVQGNVKDEWAFKEYGGGTALVVATTTDRAVNPETVAENDPSSNGYRRLHQYNQLWSLTQEDTRLVVKGSVNDYGPNENIRAVRYIGNMGYVVTFKETDPLFAFDLSEPLAPKLLGELIVPGFSMYLHPVADGRLVGVGFDGDDQGSFAWFQGIQVSLFDISDPANMVRLDNKVHGHRGSYSEVTGDHHAFFFDESRAMIGVPVVELVRPEGAGEGGSQYGSELSFSGAVLYRVEDSQLSEIARIDHNDMVPEGCINELQDGAWWTDERRSPDINRLFTVDNRLLSISRFGIKAHDPDNPASITASVPFEADDADCQSSMGRW